LVVLAMTIYHGFTAMEPQQTYTNRLSQLSPSSIAPMADVQPLLSALQVFNGAPDKASLEGANNWLQDFQHSVNHLSPWTKPDQSLTQSQRALSVLA
jgi:hypothetical protein